MGIFIVERPHQLPATAWEARDWNDFFDRLDKTDIKGGIYEEHTVGQYDDFEELREWYPAIPKDAAPDLKFWTARHLLGEGEISLTKISKIEAYKEYLAHDLYACHIFDSEEQARAALKNDEIIGHQQFKARAELQKVLGMEMAVLLEDNLAHSS